MTRGMIQKWGNSHGIRLPKHILDEAGLLADTPIEIDVSGDQIIIRKASSERKTIQQLFSGYKGTSHTDEVDWGAPQGKEIW